MPEGNPVTVDHATWLSSDRAIPARLVRPLLRFTRVEVTSGVIMLAAAALAIAWANAPFGDSYERFWTTPFEVSVGGFVVTESLRGVINDGLMALFFFVVGLEIKREIAIGYLRDRRTAALPALAALGGMLVPALLYLAVANGGEVGRGWGIPMATDIAFSLGVLALLGARVPIGAKLFLLTLAIVDDLGAIAVIAVFYTDELAVGFLAAAVAGIGVIALAQRWRIRSMAFYWPAGIVVWFLLLESGVHPTLAAVALGLLAPARALYPTEEYHVRATRILDRLAAERAHPDLDHRTEYDALILSKVARESVSPLRRLEEAIHPWSSFVIIPIFALANAGVRFEGIDLGAALTHPVTQGVAVGLLLGKATGITLFAWMAVRLGWGRLPGDVGWAHVVGLGTIAGIGFTVSLLVTSLAFVTGELADHAKIGVFAASAVAGALGYLILRTAGSRHRRARATGNGQR